MTSGDGAATAAVYGGGGGAIVVVSKCPTRGKSKTRLIPLLGEEGAATLAKAMLSDVLMTLTKCVRSVRSAFHGVGRWDAQSKFQ